VSNTVFQECDVGFYANPVSTQVTAFNISFETCWFERNTTWDIQLDSDLNYWCEATIRNCQFSGFVPTQQCHIQLEQKSKITVEGTPSGNTVIVYGADDAAVVLIRATNFVQSGVYAWTSIDAYGNVSAKKVSATGQMSSGTASPVTGVVHTFKESATLPAAQRLINRNGTQDWVVSVDAAAVDDGLYALINPNTGQVVLTLAPLGDLTALLGSLVFGTANRGSTFPATVGCCGGVVLVRQKVL
jgi:hypothetical protein